MADCLFHINELPTVSFLQGISDLKMAAMVSPTLFLPALQPISSV